MFLLAYRNLRARAGRTLFTAIAIALGVGMIFAMRLVGVTIEESARAARESRLSGADLEVSGANGSKFPDSTAEMLMAQPEVELHFYFYQIILLELFLIFLHKKEYVCHYILQKVFFYLNQ